MKLCFFILLMTISCDKAEVIGTTYPEGCDISLDSVNGQGSYSIKGKVYFPEKSVYNALFQINVKNTQGEKYNEMITKNLPHPDGFVRYCINNLSPSSYIIFAKYDQNGNTTLGENSDFIGYYGGNPDYLTTSIHDAAKIEIVNTDVIEVNFAIGN